MARFCPSRGFILDLGGDGGLLFHFILSKIAAKTDPSQPSIATTPVGRSLVELGTLHDIIPEVNTD